MASRNSVNRLAFAASIAIFGVAFSYINTAGFGQQIPKLPDSPPESRTVDSPAQSSEDFKKDPLFQEIQRMMLQSGNSLSGKTVTGDFQDIRNPSGFVKELDIDSISDARWSSIETLLSAARTLQQNREECVKQRDAVGETKTQAIVRLLRIQATELLLAK